MFGKEKTCLQEYQGLKAWINTYKLLVWVSTEQAHERTES